MLEPGTAAWIVVATVPFVVLPLLARRRFAFGAPVAVWVVAAGLSFVDGNVVTSLGVLFAAGMAAAFLLGNVRSAAQGRIGLAVTPAAALIVAYNDPTQDAGEFLVVAGERRGQRQSEVADRGLARSPARPNAPRSPMSV